MCICRAFVTFAAFVAFGPNAANVTVVTVEDSVQATATATNSTDTQIFQSDIYWPNCTVIHKHILEFIFQNLFADNLLTKGVLLPPLDL